jgi:NADP-dependent 3-hydroxy acid dehydrogenase YdfG
MVKDKVIAITGASSGIGEAAASQLASQGAKLVLGARRVDRLQTLTRKITDNGGQAVYTKTDVSRRQDLINLVRMAVDTFGRLDVLVNNAGVSHLSRLADLEVEGWEEMIDVNFKGVLYGLSAALPVFKSQGSGHFVNIISTAGLRIVPMQGVYAATKNAVRTVSEALRQESGGLFRVTGISPGFVATELLQNMPDSTLKTQMLAKADSLAISPDAIAAAIAYAIDQPDNVDVGDIVIRPSAQD